MLWVGKARHLALREGQVMLRIGIINQIMSAMGWSHPFDFDKPPVQYEDAKLRLLATDAFKHYQQNIRLFDPRSKGERKWSPKDVGDALRCILGAAGMHVLVKSKQIRSGANKGSRLYEYSIDPEHGRSMAALVNLKCQTSGHASDDPVVASALASIGFGRWQDLARMRSYVDIVFDDE
jgi:hypothetical protein